MLFAERSKSFPYLSDYLQYASMRRSMPFPMPNLAGDLVASGGMGLGVGWVTYMLSGAAGNAAAIFAGASAALIGVFGAIRFSTQSNKVKPIEEDERLDRESRAVVVRMSNLMHRRRLHRDLTPEVCAVLESASGEWSRARAALLSPYWRRSDLSDNLKQIRSQSLMAIDRSMQELLVLFSTSVPEQPSSWSWTEVVDEVVGKPLLSPQPHGHLSVFHDDALRLVHRLHELADESERLSRQLVNDPNQSAELRLGSTLEATLADLRSLRIAEEELRQDIKH